MPTVNHLDFTPESSVSATRPAKLGGSGFVRVLKATCFAVLLALAAMCLMITCWTHPVSDLLMMIGQAVGGWLPHGTVWRPVGTWSETGPPYLLDPAGLERWLSGPGLLAWVGLAIAALASSALRRYSRRHGWRAWLSDAMVMLGLVGAGSAVWMMAWGASHGRLVVGQQPLPVALGGFCVLLMWVGAAILYWLWLSRDPSSPPGDQCLACGYVTSAASGPCPECGRSREQSTLFLARRRRRRTLLRAGAMVAGAWLILAPYSMTLTALIVPYSVLDAIASKLPPSW